jgi:pimeloyl-ACP methyl ester carboxylesterase
MNERPSWLRELFPWEQKTLRVNGRSMAYVDEGDHGARPVLLLHGNPTWGFLYRDFIEPLCRSRAAPAFLGCSPSGRLTHAFLRSRSRAHPA